MTLMNVEKELLVVELIVNVLTQRDLMNVHAREAMQEMKHMVVFMSLACAPMAPFVIEMLFVSMLVEIATGIQISL